MKERADAGREDGPAWLSGVVVVVIFVIVVGECGAPCEGGGA